MLYIDVLNNSTFELYFSNLTILILNAFSYSRKKDDMNCIFLNNFALCYKTLRNFILYKFYSGDGVDFDDSINVISRLRIFIFLRKFEIQTRKFISSFKRYNVLCIFNTFKQFSVLCTFCVFLHIWTSHKCIKICRPAILKQLLSTISHKS